MTRTLQPPFARSLVVIPTVLLSLYLGSHGWSVSMRLTVCLGLGAALIMLLTLMQRRRSF